MSIENPSVNKAETKKEKEDNFDAMSSKGELWNPYTNGSLKEGVTEEQALEVQQEWNEKRHQWEERDNVHTKARKAYMHDTIDDKYGIKKSEFQEVMDEAKKIADDYYRSVYVPAYHRYTDLWTVSGRTENTNTPQEKSSSVDDLRKSLDRFKS